METLEHSPIIHQFSIQPAKSLFLTPANYVVKTIDTTRVEDAKKLNLRPLLVYSLVVEGVPIKFIKLCASDNPMSVLSFLSNAWSKNQKEGKPNVLKVGRRFAEAFPWLDQMAKTIGITMQVADEKDKSYGINQSVVQDEINTNFYFRSPRNDEPSRSISLEELNLPRWGSDGDEWLYPFEHSSSKAVRLRMSEHVKKPRMFFPEAVAHSDSWTTFTAGDWLYTNQASIPRREPAQILHEVAALSGEDDDDLGDEFEPCSLLVKNLTTNWPASIGEMAKLVGTDRKTLEWYLQGRVSLEEMVLAELHDILMIDIDPDHEYSDGSPVYKANGGYYLVASEKPREVIELYGVLSHGGDVEVSVEIIPDNHKADPSYRFLLLMAYGNPLHVLAFRRGGKSASLLDDERKLINYRGQQIVSKGLYQDVAKTLGEATNKPRDAGIMGIKLMEKWYQEIESFSPSATF